MPVDFSQQLSILETEVLRRTHETETTQRPTLSFAILLNNLAVVYHAMHRFTDSDITHKRCLAVLESLDKPARSVAQSLANRAALYRTFHEYHEAERLFQIAMTIWDQHGWPDENEMRLNLEESPNAFPTDMLWAEVIERNGMFRFFGREVQQLKESKSEVLDRAIAKLGPWYHDLQLLPQLSTCPSNRHYMINRWRFLTEFLPDDLSGKSVLDIGCNAGFFSLQMKARNAGRVVGIDIMPHCLAQARFMSHWSEQPLELRKLDVYDVEQLGKFDIVIFVGVLYHLRHPLYALEKAASVCKETLYLQSMLRGDTRDFDPAPNYPFEEHEVFQRPEFPKLYFIEKSFNGDESNWWVPNSSCLKAMARAVGFGKIQQTSHPELIVCRK